MVGQQLASIEKLAKEYGITLEGILAKKNAFGGTAPDRVKEAAHVILSRIDGEGSQDARTEALRSAQGDGK
jgi:hypothetical protein